MNSAEREQFIRLIKATLPKGKTPSLDELNNAVEKQFIASPIILGIEVSEDEKRSVVRELRAQFAIEVSAPSILKDESHTPWLEAAKATIKPYYWESYKDYLIEDKAWTPKIINNLDDETEKILELCGNPKAPQDWDRRGLVVGHVQSGKTANYTGLICKAADAGYKAIIILAGLQNTLRNQTQGRIDEGFIGYDTAKLNEKIYIGAGNKRHGDKRRTPPILTNRTQDFSKSKATLGIPLDSLNEPVVIVLKKNVSVLNNLRDWLKLNGVTAGHKEIEAPLLLIDDEADNASINTKYKSDEVTAINKAIRSVLSLFSHKTYVGYTATPFANIFIDPDTDDEMLKDDLFPRSFIISLDAPSNYFSAEKIFLQEPGRFLINNEDALVELPSTHKKTWEIDRLPSSLKEAIRCFALAVCLRNLRGQGSSHCSMMINISRFVDVQRNVRDHVSEYLKEIQGSCRVFSALPLQQALSDPTINDLYITWDQIYKNKLDPDEEWQNIQNVLAKCVSEISISLINGKSSDRLNYDDYPDGKKVIAVGGTALSRGLTLEGLTISYYLRNTAMYDTLIQMGRWFGYRPSYEDLCRVYITNQAEGHFAHVADSIQELRSDMKRMERQGSTPEEFGLRVRSHPDTLVVTAANKLGRSGSLTWKVDLSNHFIESTHLKRDRESLSANRSLGLDLAAKLRNLQNPENIGGSFLFRDVPVNMVVEFMEGFRNSEYSILSDPGLILDYIRPRDDNELKDWDVLFVGLQHRQREPDTFAIANDLYIRCQKRTPDTAATRSDVLVHRKQRIASRPIEDIGLPDEKKVEAENEFHAEKTNAKKQFPDRIYRAKRKKPLFIVHFIQYVDPGNEPAVLKYEKDAPVMAWSISLPPTSLPQTTVEYRINAIYDKMAKQFEVETEDDYIDDEGGGD
jgi:hypothetical protein